MRLRPQTSIKQHTLNVADAMTRYGRDQLVLRIALEIDGATISEQAVFLTPPRFLELPRARARVRLTKRSPREFDLVAESPAFLHAFTFDFGALHFTATDNGFDLYPQSPRTVRVTFAEPTTLTIARQQLTHRSLVDSYA